jgi:tetratricopeptide (TPR) repeat protein
VAESLGDHVRLARVHAHLALLQFLRGEHDLAVEHGLRSCQVGPIPTDQCGPARAKRAVVSVYIVRGAYDQAITLLLEDLRPVTGGAGVQHPGPWRAERPVFTCMLLARCHAERGEFAEATRYAEEAMTKAAVDGGPLLTSLAYLALGFVHCTRGDWAAAMPYLERGLELNRTKVDVHFTLFASLLGDTLMGLGRLDEALPLLEGAAERERTERPWMEAFRLKPLAEAYAASGRAAEAKRCAERALSIAGRLGLLPVQARSLQIMAKIARCLTPPDVSSALRWGHEALGLATAIGRAPLTMKCHVELGHAYLATGRIQEARKHLSTAGRLCKEMHMTAWLPIVREALEAAGSRD